MNQLDELSYVRVSEGGNDEDGGGGSRQDSSGVAFTRTELVVLSKK